MTGEITVLVCQNEMCDGKGFRWPLMPEDAISEALCPECGRPGRKVASERSVSPSKRPKVVKKGSGRVKKKGSS